jgi:sulfate adenylyltransferase subunit 1 (EFTu-like GTPase family)
MVTGASTADLAVILIDARKGVLTQTRRHSYIAHAAGHPQLVLAVNKMDLIDYDQREFDSHRRRVPRLRGLHRRSTTSRRFRSRALMGDNITASSRRCRGTRADADGASRDRPRSTIAARPSRSACRCSG